MQGRTKSMNRTNERTRLPLFRLILAIALTITLLVPSASFASTDFDGNHIKPEITLQHGSNDTEWQDDVLTLTPASIHMVSANIYLDHPVKNTLKAQKARFKVKSDNPKIAKVADVVFYVWKEQESDGSTITPKTWDEPTMCFLISAEAKKGKTTIRITDTLGDFPEETLTVVIKEKVAGVQFGHNLIIQNLYGKKGYATLKPKQSVSLRLYAKGPDYLEPTIFDLTGGAPARYSIAASKVT